MIEDGIRVCDACGLPPRDGKKLRCCSRCKDVWYHDLECQKKHYPQHKKRCRPSSKLSPTKSHEQEEQSPKFTTEARAGRGNCLVATSLIRKGERIHDKGNNSWEPLVLPVLRSDLRSTRCALCFASLNNNFYRYDEILPRQEYLLLFCSLRCRDAGRDNFRLLEEERAIDRIYAHLGGGPPKIFPTAILLYRVIVGTQAYEGKSKILKEQLDKLQHEIADATADTSMSDHHTHAVITTAVAMIQASGDLNLVLPEFEEMKTVVNRIKLNGFSVCDGESVAMGVGLFGQPSFMNHCCKPNAVQTFLYGKGEAPRLLVTAFEDIAKGDEICISYIDNLAPKQIRQRRLKNDYFFDCCCVACEDRAYNSQIIGLKCSKCDAKSPKMIVDAGLAPAEVVVECQDCRSSNTHDGNVLLKAMETLSTTEEATKYYNKLKQNYTNESWYVQNCGDQLVQLLSDLLGSQAGDYQQQQATSSSVLELLNELNQSCNHSTFKVWSSSFRHLIRQYKAAKLLLFLDPDPRQPITELRKVRHSLLPYFDQTHELIQGIDECMGQGGNIG